MNPIEEIWRKMEWLKRSSNHKDNEIEECKECKNTQRDRVLFEKRSKENEMKKRHPEIVSKNVKKNK